MVLCSSTKLGIRRPWTNIQPPRRFNLEFWQTWKHTYIQLKFKEKVFFLIYFWNLPKAFMEFSALWNISSNLENAIFGREIKKHFPQKSKTNLGIFPKLWAHIGVSYQFALNSVKRLIRAHESLNIGWRL